MIFDSHLNIKQTIRGKGMRWMRRGTYGEENAHSV